MSFFGSRVKATHCSRVRRQTDGVILSPTMSDESSSDYFVAEVRLE